MCWKVSFQRSLRSQVLECITLITLWERLRSLVCLTVGFLKKSLWKNQDIVALRHYNVTKGPPRICNRLSPKWSTTLQIPAPQSAWPSTFQQSTQSTTSAMQLKEMASEENPVTKSSGLAANPSIGAFSGSFTNCTINIFSQVAMYWTSQSNWTLTSILSHLCISLICVNVSRLVCILQYQRANIAHFGKI